MEKKKKSGSTLVMYGNHMFQWLQNNTAVTLAYRKQLAELQF